MDKYLKTIIPYCSSQEEYEEHRKLVKDFESGVGQVLYQLLLERDKVETYSWLERWWNDYAYFLYRDPIHINVSYGMTYKDVSPPVSKLQRVSLLAHLLLGIKRELEEETFPADQAGGEGRCMAAYKALFHSCRIPDVHCDYTQFYPYSETNEILVMVNDQMYTIPSLDSTTGNILQPQQIYRVLEDIVKSCESGPRYPPIGVLATENRTVWANALERIMKDPINKKSMEKIRRCAFAIVLDGGLAPFNQTDFAHRIWCGGDDVTNRFYDIPLQLIGFEGGKAGIVGEHSRMDGQPIVIVSDILLARENELYATGQATITTPTTTTTTTTDVKFTKVEWSSLDSETFKQDLDRAIYKVTSEIGRADFRVLTLPDYGKKLWKSLKVSPDAAVQMAMQLTYWQMHKKVGGTYESVSTRQYARGRTETGRSVSVDSVQFVNAMEDPTVQDRERYQKFQIASKSHIQYAKEASKGFGVDRLFLGLKLLAIQEDEKRNKNNKNSEKSFVHPIFSSGIFQRSSHWNLSTSTLAPNYITGISFGPVVEDGYGICYTFRPHDIIFNISSFHSDPATNTSIFCEKLAENLKRLRLLFEKEGKQEKEVKAKL